MVRKMPKRQDGAPVHIAFDTKRIKNGIKTAVSARNSCQVNKHQLPAVGGSSTTLSYRLRALRQDEYALNVLSCRLDISRDITITKENEL